MKTTTVRNAIIASLVLIPTLSIINYHQNTNHIKQLRAEILAGNCENKTEYNVWRNHRADSEIEILADEMELLGKCDF